MALLDVELWGGGNFYWGKSFYTTTRVGLMRDKTQDVFLSIALRCWKVLHVY